MLVGVQLRLCVRGIPFDQRHSNAGNPLTIPLNEGPFEPANWADMISSRTPVVSLWVQWYVSLYHERHLKLNHQPQTYTFFAFNGNSDGGPRASHVTTDGRPTEVVSGKWPLQACNSWGAMMNNTRQAFGATVAVEFCNGMHDCGLCIAGIISSGAAGGTMYGGCCD